MLVLLLLSCGGAGRADLPIVEKPPEAEGPALATFVLVGDTIAHGVAPGADPLADVAPLLEGADALILNHEGVLVAPPLPDTCAASETSTVLDADPSSAATYLRAPSVVATLANNHVLDCGPRTLSETIATLEGSGLLAVGAGADTSAACPGRRSTVGGLDTAVFAFLAIDEPSLAAGPSTAGAATWETCDGATAVTTAHAEGAFTIVALHLHLSPSWTSVTAPEHLERVERALDAGADLVVGHGSHVPQGVLVQGGQVALLSLGDFLFADDHPLPDAARDVVVARVAVHAREILLSFAAARLDAEGVPHPASPATTDRILEELFERSRPYGTPLVRSGDRAYLLVRR